MSSTFFLWTSLFPTFRYEISLLPSFQSMLFQSLTGFLNCFQTSNVAFLFLNVTDGLHPVVNHSKSYLLTVDFDDVSLRVFLTLRDLVKLFFLLVFFSHPRNNSAIIHFSSSSPIILLLILIRASFTCISTSLDLTLRAALISYKMLLLGNVWNRLQMYYLLNSSLYIKKIGHSCI